MNNFKKKKKKNMCWMFIQHQGYRKLYSLKHD